MLDFRLFFAKDASGAARPMRAHGALLRGARAAGKTSFAFQAAVNTVLDGGCVVVLCREALLYAKVPAPFVRLASLPPDALARIEFIYVESWAAATAELMCITHARDVPALVIVDDDGFVHDTAAQPGSMASCLSYLENIHAWLQRCNNNNNNNNNNDNNDDGDSRRAGAVAFCYVVVSNAFAATTGSDAAAAAEGGGSGVGTATAAGYYHHHHHYNNNSSSERLSLPYAAFPVVDVHFSSPGVVAVTPHALDVTAAPLQLHLQWRDGLQLASC